MNYAFDTILFSLIGIMLGFFCGLIPGIHPNTIGAIVAQTLGQEQSTAIILIAVLGTYSAVSFLPAMFLAIPEGNTQISLLPAQRMYKMGKAQEGLIVFSFSLCISAIVALIIVFLFSDIVASGFSIVKPYTAIILIIISLMLISREKKIRKIIFAILVFGLSAILGFVSLNSHIPDPLFALFVGFFAIPALMTHKDNQIKIKDETQSDIKYIKNIETLKPLNHPNKNERNVSLFLPYIILGVILGAIADYLPGVSTPSQLAVFSSIVSKKMDAQKFISQIASIEASHCVFSIASASKVNIARVGAVAIANEAYKFSEQNMGLFLAIFALSLGIGALFILHMGKKIEHTISNIKFEKIAKILCIYLLALCFLLNGAYGVVVMSVATLIGFLPLKLNVSRTHVMGSIIVASIIYALN